MKKLVLFGMTLALALPLVAARPAAAAQLKVVAQATGDNDPGTLSWIDDSNGSTKTDQATSRKIHDMFANLQYVFTDGNLMVLGKLNGDNLQAILPAVFAIDVSDGKGYYVVHERSKGTSLDGTVYRFSSQPDQGLARLTLIQWDDQGNATTTYIEQGLTFVSPKPNPAPQPTPNPFGF